MTLDTVSSGNRHEAQIFSDVVSSPTDVHLYGPMKAGKLLKDNIDALLRERRYTRKDLAQWCFRSESWISKIYREERREFPMDKLDRIADFFGMVTYQLFQPGVASTTERRLGDRRVGKERRIGQPARTARRAGEEIDAHRPQRKGPHVASSSPLVTALQQAAEAHAKQVAAIVARFDAPRRQTPAAGDLLPDTPPRRRTLRRSTAQTSE